MWYGPYLCKYLARNLGNKRYHNWCFSKYVFISSYGLEFTYGDFPYMYYTVPDNTYTLPEDTLLCTLYCQDNMYTTVPGNIHYTVPLGTMPCTLPIVTACVLLSTPQCSILWYISVEP